MSQIRLRFTKTTSKDLSPSKGVRLRVESGGVIFSFVGDGMNGVRRKARTQFKARHLAALIPSVRLLSLSNVPFAVGCRENVALGTSHSSTRASQQSKPQ